MIDKQEIWSGHWIAGKFKIPAKSSTKSKSISPNTGKTLFEFISFEKDIAAEAVNWSVDQADTVAAWSQRDRIHALTQLRQLIADHADVLVQALCREAGKPSWEARQELMMSTMHLDTLTNKGEMVFTELLSPASLDGRGSYRLKPIGTAAAYIPFSTPVLSTVMYAAAAILAGTPMIAVAAPQASVTLSTFATILQKSSIPQLGLSILFGNFTDFRNLLAEKRIAAVLYTGSREHCDEIRTASRGFLGRQLILQSGGKNPVIVDESADINMAAAMIVNGLTQSAGQLCSSTNRVVAHYAIARELEHAIAESIAKLDIRRTDTDFKTDDRFMGPVYSTKAVEKYLRFQNMASREQGRTVLWGKQLTEFTGGSFVTPGFHIVSNFEASSAYQTNVMLGPDLTMYECASLAKAVDLVNLTEAAYVVSCIGSQETLKKEVTRLTAPHVVFNAPTVEQEAPWPLAGRLQSGHHRFHGLGLALYLSSPQGFFGG